MNPTSTSKRMLNPASTPGVTTSTMPASEGRSTNPTSTTHRKVNPTSTPDVITSTVPPSEGLSTNPESTTHRTVNPDSTPDVTSFRVPASEGLGTNPDSTTHRTVNPTRTPDVITSTIPASEGLSTNPESTTHRTVKPTSTPDVITSTIPASAGISTNADGTTQRTLNQTSTPDITTSTAPALLTKPVLDLNVTALNHQITNPRFVAALFGGEAAVVNEYSQVMKINKTGHTIKELYNCQSCNNIYGLLLLGSNLNVIHSNGTIVEIQLHTGQLLNVCNISDVHGVYYFGSLWSDPSKIPNIDILLLPDSDKGEVFSYNLTSEHKQVHLTGLSFPTSVSYSFYNNSTHYIVSQYRSHTISIYNSAWDPVLSFGGYGGDDGDLIYPLAAIMSYNNTILVTDYSNHRISVFTTDGVFLYHLLTQSDGINGPTALSYYKPYLWVVNEHYAKLNRYRVSE